MATSVGTKIVDIVMYRGQDLALDVVLDPVVNITGWNIVFTMRRDYGPVLFPVEITKSTGSGIVITDGPNALFTIALDSIDTTHLSLGVHVFDVQRVNTPPRDPLIVGTITLLDLVNRSA